MPKLQTYPTITTPEKYEALPENVRAEVYVIINISGQKVFYPLSTDV